MVTASQVESQAAAYLAPCPGPEPAGSNPGFHPKYEALRTAMAALDSPTGGEIDWAEVASLGKAVLTDVAKDLLAGSYLAYALMKTRKLEGLAIGLAMLHGMIEQYWDNLFPPARRMRGRGNALEWLTNRLETGLPELALTAEDRPALDIVIDRWKSLSHVVREKFEDHAPAVRGVSDALTRLDVRIPKQAPAAATPDPSPAAATSEPSSTAAPTEPPPLAPSTPPAAATPEPPPPSPEQPADPLEKLRADASPWLDPIPRGAEEGSDPRYQAEYEQARTEMTKLDSPGAEPPEWSSVVQAAATVLKTKGKDLLMASYWTFARFKLEGLRALPLGLVVIAELLERYQDRLFPARPRGRGNAVTWLVDTIEPSLAELKLTANDRPHVVALEAAFKTFGAATRTHLGENAPSLSPLSDRLKRMHLALPAETKPEPPKPTPPAAAPPPPQPREAPPAPPPAQPAGSPPATASVPAPAAPAEAANVEGIDEFLTKTGTALFNAGSMLLDADPRRALAYRLIRQGAWLAIDKGPRQDGNKTFLPPIPDQQFKNMTFAMRGSKPELALPMSEKSLPRWPYFLTLHWVTWTALDRLGEAYVAAKEAVVAETRAFLVRLPQLPDLLARDGTPLASEETKQWLADHVLTGPEGAGGTEGPSPDDPGPQMEEVKQRIQAQKLTEGMELAQKAIAEATPRQRLVRRLVLAELLLGAGETGLAHALFTALDRELRQSPVGLFDWEPALASRCLQGVIRSTPKPVPGRPAEADIGDALGRLGLVDPAAAARLKPSK